MEPANDQNIYIDSGKLNCLSDSAYFLENWNECLPNETFVNQSILEFKEEEAKAIVLYRDEARRCYYSKREGHISFFAVIDHHDLLKLTNNFLKFKNDS